MSRAPSAGTPKVPGFRLIGQTVIASAVKQFRAHPWHGVDPGPHCPDEIVVYIEIVPTDTVKFELNKDTGLLCVDRPQKFSSFCPTLYGFVPRTLCGPQVAAYCETRTGRTGLRGDGDALDVCVLSERPISHGDILLRARPVGGFRMLDGGESDDKIVAVLIDDAVFGGMTTLSEVPATVVDRLHHYFLTYKLPPGSVDTPRVEIAGRFEVEEAHEIIMRSIADYEKEYGVSRTEPAHP